MQKENVCMHFLLQRVWEVLRRWKMALGNLSQDPAKTTTMAKHSTENTDLPFICNKYIYIKTFIHMRKHTKPPYIHLFYYRFHEQIIYYYNYILSIKTYIWPPTTLSSSKASEWNDKNFMIFANGTVSTIANHAASPAFSFSHISLLPFQGFISSLLFQVFSAHCFC